MAGIKVMKLWTALVSAFLALFTALGLVSSTVATAVPQNGPARNSGNAGATALRAPSLPAQARTSRSRPRSFDRTLPPTMKQRIHAEAHGKSPRCRHRPPTDVARHIPKAAEDTTSDEISAGHRASVLPLRR
jgi:Family of unknown function (DUF6344)